MAANGGSVSGDSGGHFFGHLIQVQKGEKMKDRMVVAAAITLTLAVVLGLLAFAWVVQAGDLKVTSDRFDSQGAVFSLVWGPSVVTPNDGSYPCDCVVVRWRRQNDFLTLGRPGDWVQTYHWLEFPRGFWSRKDLPLVIPDFTEKKGP